MYPALSPQQREDMSARWQDSPGGFVAPTTPELIAELKAYRFRPAQIDRPLNGMSAGPIVFDEWDNSFVCVGDQARNDAALPRPIPADAPLPDIEWGPERGLRSSTKAMLILAAIMVLIVIGDRLFT